MGSISEPQRLNEYALPLKANEYAPAPTPSLQEWHQLWKVWDLVTGDMISEQTLLDKPIQLRNCLLFYLGHIPTLYVDHPCHFVANIDRLPVRTYICLER